MIGRKAVHEWSRHYNGEFEQFKVNVEIISMPYSIVVNDKHGRISGNETCVVVWDEDMGLTRSDIPVYELALHHESNPEMNLDLKARRETGQ